MTADLLRKKFLEFFKSKKHRIVASDSLVPQDDPTVLFTPAGMNQFKRQFLGYVNDFSRAATAQRCLRTDDLDKVGKTPSHHTFFEMLGNFSFGDYFKEEAISWAWEFLTEELVLSKEKLWVSIYKDDEEAYRIWNQKIKVPAEKIVRLGDKENFWPSEAKEKGPNGPCGPCSEIFFDQGKATGCGKPECSPACGCGRFLEVWNLVFTQFNRKEGGVLEPLPQKNIDTGMGLERLAAVMQGVPTNFETDLFKPLIGEVTSRYQGAKVSNEKELTYAIVDHLRAVVFAISDGVIPSNEGRGYVIRKLIRKASLHLRALGFKKPFLYKLVPVLSEIMHQPYPQLNSNRENISGVVLSEEKAFLSILDSSDRIFAQKFQEVLKHPDAHQTGVLAFQLYDTYGIPFEVTQEWLEKKGITVSEEVFNRELEIQKTRSKLQGVMKGDVFNVNELILGVKKIPFVGYGTYKRIGKILKILKGTAEVRKSGAGEEVKIILDKTVFYPESGGQVGDTGELLKGKNRFEVLDTQKFDKVIVHIGKVVQGIFRKSNSVTELVDVERRLAIARNHTATHLLQAALRQVLGLHVQQQGSLVAKERLRFDFTHYKALTQEELERVEQVVNEWVFKNESLVTKELSLPQAKKSGALAFFGEKYEDKVRVVSISDVSKELCGGTHLEATGQIGFFKIIQEGSVASGVRRIEAVTGTTAYQLLKKEEKVLKDMLSLLGTNQDKAVQELEKRLARIKDIEKELGGKQLRQAQSSLDDLISSSEVINGVKVITWFTENLGVDALRKTVDLIKQKTDNALILLGSNISGKAALVMGITADLCAAGFDASRFIRDIASVIGGSGGGRKDFAQAGGTQPENLKKAGQELKNIIQKLINSS